ncbi:MAG TPA: hypothetical protein VKQ09_06830, partial [Sphingomonas sp.]|nr:hypothetical protein [Sphingomonas sp.]
MDPVTQLANTARVALGPRAGDRTLLATDDILAIVRASAPLVGLTSGHVFTEDEIASAARDLEALFVVAQGPSIRLLGETQPPPWYLGERRRPGAFFLRYLQKLSEGGWAPRALEVLEESTADVVELIDDPDRDVPWDWRGLVVGNVQSGKTAHYAGVI